MEAYVLFYTCTVGYVSSKRLKSMIRIITFRIEGLKDYVSIIYIVAESSTTIPRHKTPN